MEQKVWLITGTSTGFGRIWTIAALEAGDKVVATARNLDDVADIKEKYGDQVHTCLLEVSDRKACFDVAQNAVDQFGRIDVLINNAGYGQFGCIEELNETEVKQQMEVNVYGSIWMIQAVLPYMRQQQAGRILQVSSIGGLIAYPGIGMYHASKFAVEAICESLAQEVEHMGIHVTLIEPGGYETDFASRSGKTAASMSEYDHPREKRKANAGPPSVGDPQATAQPVLDLVNHSQPPLRLLMGKKPWEVLKPTYEARMKSWEEWMPVTIASHGDRD